MIRTKNSFKMTNKSPKITKNGNMTERHEACCQQWHEKYRDFVTKSFSFRSVFSPSFSLSGLFFWLWLLPGPADGGDTRILVVGSISTYWKKYYKMCTALLGYGTETVAVSWYFLLSFFKGQIFGLGLGAICIITVIDSGFFQG